jgi:DNA polymerase I-like protein with 3'-5' exonuclease and polymerase domains
MIDVTQFQLGFWNGEKLRRKIAIDTETTLIRGKEVPNLVTFQAYDGAERVYFVKQENLADFLTVNSNNVYIFHNAPFDLEVIDKELTRQNKTWDLFERMENNQIYDTAILYRLLHLAVKGYAPRKYNLALVSREVIGLELDKNADIRLNFGDYLDSEGTIWEDIPEESLNYAALDVIVTYQVYEKLIVEVRRTGSETELTHLIQLLGAWALNRVELRGIGFDIEKATKMAKGWRNEMIPHANVLATYGWLRGVSGAVERYENVVTNYLKLDLPITEEGRISSKTEDIEAYKDRPFINSYIEYHKIEHLTNYIEPLIDLKKDRVHPRYDTLKNTGRTGASHPNIQNPPRSGGIRELFIPKEGHQFFVIDYSFIELCTLAQTCKHKIGYSKLGEVINSGKDPHTYYASVLLEKDEKDVTKSERQKAKVANFGFPGGLGIDKFVDYAEKSYGVKLDHLEAKEMRDAWFIAFPEIQEYLRVPEDDTWTITGRLRSDASYCATKNTPFQGLAADGAKIALYLLEKAGFKVVAFIHDEVIIEHPIENSEKRFLEAQKIMVDAMKQVCPDVKVGVEGHILDKWMKM